MDLSSDLDDAAKSIALNHHEKWDGSGYTEHVNTDNGSISPNHNPKIGKKGVESLSLRK